MRIPLLVAVVCLGAVVPPLAQTGRTVVPLNRDWAFTYRPAGTLDTTFAAPEHDDAEWAAVAVPHTWSTYETTGEEHPFISAAAERDDPYWWYGWGLYRKRFTPADSLRGRKLFVEFDGVQKYSRVYLNGAFVGEHAGGYNSFSLDLTPHVRWGEENVLAVAVSNRRDDERRIPPMTAGNFNVYGGLYRDVRLVLTDPLHIPYQGNAHHPGGTFVTTPAVDSSRATIRVRTWVRNDHRDRRTVTLRTVIRDPQGAAVAQKETTAPVVGRQTVVFDQRFDPIADPQLWSPEAPHVYAVETEVLAGARRADTYTSPLGFRWFRWDDRANTLVLNGAPLRLNGTNRHQEYPWLGDAIPDWVTRRDLLDIRRGLGHNFMRAAHYPNDPLLYHLADSLGIVMVEEVPNIKNIDFSEPVQERNVRAMIRRDRNHPSILFWSMGNETNDGADSRWAAEEDGTRLIHARKARDVGDAVDHTHEQLDLEQLLRVTVRGWYTEDDAPAGRSYRPQNGQHASTERWQHERARVPDGSVRGDIPGDVSVWLYADHGADREYRNAPVKHVNPKGWVDLYRVPKQLYYLWQANFTDAPMVHVHPYYWRQAYLGQRKPILVDTNGEAVELFVNGRSLGRRAPDSLGVATFEGVEVMEGTLEAVAAKGGAEVRDRVVMAGPPARLTLTPSHTQIAADRSGLATLLVGAVDADGVPVLDADPPLAWSVEGPGRLVGPPAWSSDAAKHEAMGGAQYVALPVANLVRSTNTPGPIRVRVTAPGLEGAGAVIEAVAPPPLPPSGIEQPRLDDAGRVPVARDDAFAGADALPDVAPLNPPDRALRLSADDARSTRRAAAVALVLETNPGLDTTTAAFRAFADALAETLERTGGELVEDDVNALAARYTDARRLAGYLYLLPLHLDYKRALQAAYADRLVRRGETFDLEAERARLAPLQAPGARLIVLDAQPGRAGLDYNYVPDTYQAAPQPLPDLLALVHPDFAALPVSQQQTALAYVAAINPHVHAVPGEDYRIDPERPLLIPSLDVLRALERLER